MYDRIFLLQYSISFRERVADNLELSRRLKTAPGVLRFGAIDPQDAYNFFVHLNRRFYGIVLGPEDILIAPEVVTD